MNVLVFEDNFDIETLLIAGNIDVTSFVFIQYWNSENHLIRIKEFTPDALLLDYFMPPYTGLEVLHSLNQAIKKGMIRPKIIVGISSDMNANKEMVENGADSCVEKRFIAKLDLWNDFRK